jgi:hypothetical protein
MRHRLTDKDLKARTGICAVCGPVSIAPKKNGQGATSWRCARAARDRSSPSWRRRNHGPKPHGLNGAEAVAFLEGKTCAICGGSDRLVVDHCHRQGSIRGALCANCNTGLGMFADDPDRLRAAIAYLAGT